MVDTLRMKDQQAKGKRQIAFLAVGWSPLLFRAPNEVPPQSNMPFAFREKSLGLSEMAREQFSLHACPTG
jgi:hypothetical protein